MNALKNITELTTAGGSPWFKQWFDSAFYHQLYANRDEKEAEGFIDHLLGELYPKENAYMLDLGCGAGRHAHYLASKGFNVTGLDLARSSIRKARNAESGTLQFYRHDMRVPFGIEPFDYIFNFFTSFGYFKDGAENHKVINNMSNALKKDGTVVIDYLNVEYSEDHLVPYEEKEIDGIGYHISRYTDDRYFYKKIVIDDLRADGPLEIVEQVEKLDLADFEYLLTSNGLKIKKVFGDYELNEYNNRSSKRLIMVAKKMKS